MIKNFITSHWKIIRIILIIIISPALVYITTTLIETVFIIGNYLGTFLRGVYTFFAC